MKQPPLHRSVPKYLVGLYKPPTRDLCRKNEQLSLDRIGTGLIISLSSQSDSRDLDWIDQNISLDKNRFFLKTNYSMQAKGVLSEILFMINANVFF